jgi:hypothetical protein
LKRVFWLLGAVALVAFGLFLYQGRQLDEKVKTLLAQAKARGLRIDMREIVKSRPESGTILVRALEGNKNHNELRKLSFDDSNVPAARKLVASAETQYETIAEFANLDVYAPPRELSAGMAVQDYSTIATAMRAEAWRGYLLAIDNKFQDALASLEIQIAMGRRLQDEGFPIGRMIARRGDKDIHKIVLALVYNNTIDANRLTQLLTVLNDMQPADWKSSLEFELATGLLYLDEIESGKLDLRRQVALGPLKFKVARSSRELNEARTRLLSEAIEAFDTWGSAQVSISDSGDTGFAVEDPLGFVTDLRGTVEIFRRHERNDLAERRAIRLILHAYRWKAKTGQLPTVAQLLNEGVETEDPWTGEPLSLHQDANGRIWVGAMRELRNEMPPRTPKLVNVLEWRP